MEEEKTIKDQNEINNMKDLKQVIIFVIVIVINYVHALEQCKIYFTYPLNWETVKKGITNSHPQPFDAQTVNNMCSQYKSNACCSTEFVNKFVYEYFKGTIEDLETPRCRAAITSVECFACGLNQFDYMVVDDDQQKAEVKICRKTCQSIFDDCKDDDGFRDKEGMKPDNANQVCEYIDQLDDDDIEIKITDSIDHCFLYDNDGPKIVSTSPWTGNHEVSAATEEFSVVLDEPVAFGKSGKIRLYDGNGKEISVLDIVEDSENIKLVKTKEEDDTIEIKFANHMDDNNNNKKNCILKAQNSKYFIDIDEGSFIDRNNNSFAGIHGRAWEFQTEGVDKCPFRHSVDVGLIIGLSLLGVFLIGIITFVVIYYRRRVRETQRKYTTVNDTLSLNVFNGDGIIPDLDGKI